MKGFKPLGGRAYGSIPHLPGSRLGIGDHHITEGQANIATVKKRKGDFIIVQEKVDGTCMSIAKINGKIIPLTRRGHLANTSKQVQHHAFHLWVMKKDNIKRFDAILEEGERLCGEWIMMAHGTRYKNEGEPFIPFDIMRGSVRCTWGIFIQKINDLIRSAWTIWVGDSLSVKDAMGILKHSSHGAIDPVEGAVWRVENHQTNYPTVNFLCKYVRLTKIDGKYLPSNNQVPYWNYYLRDIGVSEESLQRSMEGLL